MHEDKQGPMTLAINDSQMDLRVITFTGREALNQPYRFDIDVISRHRAVDCTHLLGRTAYLGFGPLQQGIHGQISEASQVHAGHGSSLYRISLTPALQQLTHACRSRTFNGLSVPHIIRRLLEDNGLQAGDFRFERTTGVYPIREICVQYQETDLHLLQRLCEEEGISFRFEHHADRHVLVFADDPASFPELLQSSAIPIVGGHETDRIGITHFAEQLTLTPSYSSHACENLALLTDFRSASVCQAAADTTPPPGVLLSFGMPAGKSVRQRQVSARALERLRCERRVIRGSSNQTALASGQIMRVTEHPERLMNDQWLLTEVRHEGTQWGELKGASPEDIAAIIQASRALRALSWKPMSPAPWPATVSGRTSACQYRNEFSVIPWAMPFRPSLRHPKPAISGVHAARLSRPRAFDAIGRLSLRFEWQPSGVDEGGPDSWAALCSAVEIDGNTTEVSVGFFDDDPDQPVVCGVLPCTVEQLKTDRRRSGLAEHEQNQVRLTPDQHFHLQRHGSIRLRSARGTIEISAGRLTFTGISDA